MSTEGYSERPEAGTALSLDRRCGRSSSDSSESLEPELLSSRIDLQIGVGLGGYDIPAGKQTADGLTVPEEDDETLHQPSQED